MLGADGILPQVQYFEVLESGEVPQLLEIGGNEVPSEIQLPQTVEAGEVLHSGNLIYCQR